jgi:hypothetical protein
LNRNRNRVIEVLGLKPEKQLCRFASRVLDQIGLGFEDTRCGSAKTVGGVSLKRGDRYYTVSGYQTAADSISSGAWEYVPYGQQPKEYLDLDDELEYLF